VAGCLPRAPSEKVRLFERKIDLQGILPRAPNPGANLCLDCRFVEVSTVICCSENVVQEIEGYLSGIEEVTQYVQVAFSPSFVTLNMLKNLRVIHGEKLFNSKYVGSAVVVCTTLYNALGMST